MQDFITDWINDLGTIYSGFLGGFVTNIFTTIFLIVLIRIVYEFASMIFPGIKSLVYTVFKPFRLLHIWFHIQAAKSLNTKYGKKTHFSVLFSTGMGAGSERSLISIVSTDRFTTKDAISIARAPLYPSLIMLLALIIIGPLMQQGIFVFIHLYFLAGITLVMLPSGHDNLFIFNTILTRTTISAWYMVLPIVSFALTATIYTFKYQLLDVYPPFWWVEPFIMGLYSTWIYLIALAFVVWKTSDDGIEEQQNESKNSEDLELEKEDLDYIQQIHSQNQFQNLIDQT